VRRFVTKTIGRHPAVDDAELLVAELIANVILHAGDATHMSVTVAISGSLVRVDVCDNGSSGFPHVRDTDVDCDNGRGLQIVNQLALRWGFVLESGQTRFWAEVAA
jgi:anti-sigma regulatory factor (Ser/Thr protein kinase)